LHPVARVSTNAFLKTTVRNNVSVFDFVVHYLLITTTHTHNPYYRSNKEAQTNNYIIRTLHLIKVIHDKNPLTAST
jgi:hypothetical protein